MSAAIGAALAGARTMTATSSQGLALMAEIVYIAASMRAPIVMALGNRALSGPINIHCDHSDSMLIRDSGVVQLFAENAQEAYDLMVMAPRLAEHPDVLLPVLVCLDGFTITHSAEPVVAARRRCRRTRSSASTGSRTRSSMSAAPTTHGPFAMPDYYYELRRQQGAALTAALDVFEELADEFAALSGRRYGGARAATASTAPSARSSRSARQPARSRTSSTTCVTRARRSVCSSSRSFRPLPVRGDRRRALAVSTGSSSSTAPIRPGGVPPLAAEVAAALYGSGAELESHVYGLGGRDLHPEDVRAVFAGGRSAYVGVRGDAWLV